MTYARNPQEKMNWLRAAACIQVDICVDWPWGLDQYGYGQAFYQGKNRGAHRVVCEMVNGPCPAGMQAAHSCGRPTCASGRHLRWDTRKGNQADRIIHGTTSRGEKNQHARLSEEQVLEIRALADVVSQSELALRYGVDRSSISYIINGKRWAHV